MPTLEVADSGVSGLRNPARFPCPGPMAIGLRFDALPMLAVSREPEGPRDCARCEDCPPDALLGHRESQEEETR